MKNENNNNPYLAAKAEWVERYGSYISQKRNWQIVAFISLIITLISVSYVGYIGSQNKLIPYIIEVDKLGNTQNIGMVNNKEVDIKNPNVTKYSLSSFITAWRTIWGTDNVQKKYILDAYNYLKPQTKAYNIINDYFIKNNPFEKLRKENVKVKILSIVLQDANNWQVEWEETTTTTTAEPIKTDIYRGFFTVEQNLPQNEEQILKNPLGFFIVDMNFAPIIK